MRSFLVLTFVLAGCQSGICGASELTAALAAAHPHDEIVVGACEVAGAFSVPAGVSLRGHGRATVLRSVSGGAPVLELAPGETSVHDLSIAVDHGGIGIHAAGSGSITLQDLGVRVTQGVGMGVRDVTDATITAVEIAGPINDSNAAFAPSDPTQTGAWGLVALDSTLAVQALQVHGFAVGAVSVEGGQLTWTDTDDSADVYQTRGVGIAVYGVQTQLQSVEIAGILSGLGMPGLALGASDSATLTASDLGIAGGAGYGVFADHSDVTLTNTTVTDVGLVGIQIQGGTLTADQLTLLRNGGAGVALIDAGTVSIDHAMMADQREVSLPTDLTSSLIGDGLHVRRRDTSAPAIDLHVGDVTLTNNARVGLLVDAAGSTPARFDLTRVSVSSEAAELGAVSQNTTLPSGWDASVTRAGSAVTNDPAFTGGLDLVGIVMPPAITARPPSF